VFEAEPALVDSALHNVLCGHRAALVKPMLEAGLLGADGKLRESLYTTDFVRETLYHCDAPEQWALLLPWLDRPRALNALIAAGYLQASHLMVEAGVDPNLGGTCGTTPLVTLMATGDVTSTQTLEDLLDAGASLAQAAPPACDAGALTPLRALMQRHLTQQGTPSEGFMRVLMARGVVDAPFAQAFADDEWLSALLDGGQ
jgi:hypothetical protein